MNKNALIEIINENGLSIIEHNEDLFKNFKSKFSQEETALLMLIFSKKEFINELKMWYKNQNEIAKLLNKLYHFDHEYAFLISEELLNVFSDQQLDIWDANHNKGIYAFMNSRFKCSNEICTCWRPRYTTHCYMRCTLNYELLIGVKEDNKVLEFINTNFNNEFVKKNAIANLYKKLINEAIKKDFNYYVNSEDECEPWCEDYTDEILDTLSKKYGLEIEVLEWDGSTSDYISTI